MAREIPQYISQLNIGSMPQVQFSTAQGDTTMKVSAQMGAISEDMQRKSNDIEKLTAQTTLRENLHRISQEHQANPASMREAMDSYKSGFVKGIKNSELAAQFDATFGAEALPYLDRATQQYGRNLDDQHETALLSAQQQNLVSLGSIVPNLQSPIPEVKKAAMKSIESIFNNSAEVATTKKSDGSYMFSPQQQLAMAAEGQKQLISSFTPQKQLEILGDNIGGFNAALQDVFKHEGGYNASDGNTGNPVNMGINQGSHPEVDVKTLTPEQAAAIYKKDYWDAYKIGELRPDQQAIVMDGVVNHWSGFKDKLVDAARNGASASELINMRQAEYDRLAATGKYSKSVIASWNNRLADYEHLTLSEHLNLLDVGAKDAIKRSAYSEIEAGLKLQRENPVMAAVKQGATSLDQIVQTQALNGTNPQYASVIENETAKSMVEKLNQSAGTDDVVAFASNLQQTYGKYMPNAIRDLKTQGKMKPEFEGALSLSLYNNPNFKEHIDLLSQVGATGKEAVASVWRDNGFKQKDLTEKLAVATEEWKKLQIAEGQSPDTAILESMVMAKMNKDLTGDYDKAIEWAMTPDAQNYRTAQLDGIQYRIPTLDAQGNPQDANAIEDRVQQAYADMLPRIAEMNKKKDYHLGDKISPYLNDEQDGLYFKTFTGEPILDEQGNRLSIKFKDVIAAESSKERLDRIRKELWNMPYNERDAYRKKEFGFK
jgi:hypothetical protein